jgi:hypothetical protein
MTTKPEAFILRDVLETVFLTDYFAGDRTLIERWRFADKKARIKDFGPVRVREALDARDGFTEKKRFAMYEIFSELAGHPTMKSAFMMRPQPDGDAVICPFVEATTLDAVISEMGRLAIQVGEKDHPLLSGRLAPRAAEPSRLREAQAALDRNLLSDRREAHPGRELEQRDQWRGDDEEGSQRT